MESDLQEERDGSSNPKPYTQGVLDRTPSVAAADPEQVAKQGVAQQLIAKQGVAQLQQPQLAQ
jgi:hypothetical protein